MSGDVYPWSIGGVAVLKLKLTTKWLRNLYLLRVSNMDGNKMGHLTSLALEG